jgi:NAD(P)-dependent dehydrogenase (short-subunit alcohol dehydrogenase family)
MSSLAEIRASNAAFSTSYLPVGVFIGGTSGIGQGLAEKFARITKGNAQIVIVGRNRTSAEESFATFPKPTDPNAKQVFIPCDVTLMKNVGAATKEILSTVPKINFLVITTGFFSSSGRDETEEGIDRKLAAHYYSRFKFIRGLMPALEKAKSDGEEARVLSVMAANTGGEIDLDDLGLKKTFSVSNAASAGPAYNDCMVMVSFFRLCLCIHDVQPL